MIGVILGRILKEPPRHVTLNALQKLAAVLYRIRLALWALSLVAMLWFVLELAGDRPAESAALPALTGFLWATLLLGIAYGLSIGPPAIEPDDGVWQRLTKRARRAAFGLLSLLMLVLAGFVVYLSWRSFVLALG
jgi:hypothetical protein